MRVAIMSFAHLHAEAYVHNLKAIPSVEFIGFADEETSRGAHFAQAFDIPLFESYEALLATQPNAVIVCSENAKHRPLVEMAARHGVHILCEKPLATSVEDAQAMVEICQAHDVLLMTAFPMRFSTPLLEVKKSLESNQLGRIFACNSVNQGECPKHIRSWFVDKDLAGGGAITDHVVHLADILRWFFQQEVVEVYAQSNHILYADQAEVETGGLVMLTFEGGAFATIDCSWSKPPYYPTWGGLSLELVGERGLLTVDAFKQVMTVYRHTHQRPTYGYWGSDANQAMVNEFITAVAQRRSPLVTGTDGLRAVEIVDAAYRSVASGQPISLPPSR